MHCGNKLTGWTYAGLFMVTLATLMHEILLTRVFSVTMWYHFAFVAISVAMFGMTVGALLVYLFPQYFPAEQAAYQMSWSAVLFSIALVASTVVQARAPFIFSLSIWGFLSAGATYSVTSLPFVFSGICVCLALTRFPDRISRVYAVDLAGAALGCVLVIYTLRITDGPTAVVVVASLAALGSIFFAMSSPVPARLRVTARLTCILFASLAVANTILVWNQASLLRLKWAKGERQPVFLYEKWNSFSRVTVSGNPNVPRPPFGWGLSSTYPPGHRVRELKMLIDASAETVLTAFHGDFSKLDYLRYDVTNIVHYLRPDSSVLIVGTGGERDVLSALLFHQKRVVGVEINRAILNATNRTFGDFTGRLDRYPQVRFVNDEARSYITRQKRRFGIIQISLVDTWAATAAGALILTENSLYTVDAWKVFLAHLTAPGILSVSRWYGVGVPYEVYRLDSLASRSLQQLGVADPRRHIIIVKSSPSPYPWPLLPGVGTILVSREPFSDRDLDTLEDVARRMKFQVILSPREALDPTFAALATGKNLAGIISTSPYNLAPSTDNKPFFFFTVRVRDILDGRLWHSIGMQANWNAVFVLGSLLVIVVTLTLLCIIVPLLARTGKRERKDAGPLLVYFGAIGLGFMLVEISQMQRLMIFLGHPTYGLSVVLFSLLLSSGLGSYWAGTVGGANDRRPIMTRLAALLGVLILFGLLTPAVASEFRASITPVRILVAVAILFPLGIFMGMPFPLGMKQASRRSESLTPWLWGINGATSVCASVLAVVIALSFGISASFWSGFWCYAVAFAVFVWMSGAQRARPPLGP